VPNIEFPVAIPFTAQLTAVFVVPVTVAVNCLVDPAATVEVPGATTMDTEEGVGVGLGVGVGVGVGVVIGVGAGVVTDEPPPHPVNTSIMHSVATTQI